MKITTSDERIAVDDWSRKRFEASAQEITQIRVMADKAVPRGAWNRLRLALGANQARDEIARRYDLGWRQGNYH